MSTGSISVVFISVVGLGDEGVDCWGLEGSLLYTYEFVWWSTYIVMDLIVVVGFGSRIYVVDNGI